MAKPKAKAKPKAAKSKAKAKAKTKPKPKAKAKAKPKAKPSAKAPAKVRSGTAAEPSATKGDAAKPKATAQTTAETAAATQPAAAGPTASPRDPVARAIAGDVGALYELAQDIADEGQRDISLYRWLAIAADHGSEEAGDALGDMLETSNLRYDDDHGAQGDIHFELAVAYLTGTDGLARDLERGKEHLVQARRCDYPEQIQEGPRFLAEARARLDAETLAVFDGVYNGQPLAEGGGGEEADDDDDDEEDYG